MLVLTRFPGEKICIGNNIVLMVVEICGGNPPKVRIGIDAPRDIPVHREEIQRQIAAEVAKPT